MLDVFTTINEEQGSGTVSKDKTELSMLDGGDVPIYGGSHCFFSSPSH